jgi:hypothetical protein
VNKIGSCAPLRLRLVTPRENVLDARILVRREPGAGVALLAFSALLAAALASTGGDRSSLKSGDASDEIEVADVPRAASERSERVSMA